MAIIDWFAFATFKPEDWLNYEELKLHMLLVDMFDVVSDSEARNIDEVEKRLGSTVDVFDVLTKVEVFEGRVSVYAIVIDGVMVKITVLRN